MSHYVIRKLVQEAKGERSAPQVLAKPEEDRDKSSNGRTIRFDLAMMGDEEEEANETKSEKSEDEKEEDVNKKKSKKKKKIKQQPQPVKPTKEDDFDFEDEVVPSTSTCNHVLPSAPDTVIISVDGRFLNYENEQRKSLSTRAAFEQSLLQSNSRKAGRSKISVRKHLFMSPKNWPTLSRDLMSMEIESRTEKLMTFRFVHTKKYQEMQEQFRTCLETADAGELVALLNLYPNHIETLVQFSDILLSEDSQMASQLIERALSCFESIFHPRFNLTLGSCRLDFRRPENRTFFNVLFRHMNILDKKEYPRTALEICKLILSLDPEGDPLSVLLAIDSLALKSGQYDFILSFYEKFSESLKLDCLPSFAYSVPLCRFLKISTTEDEDTTVADEQLRKGLLAFPTILMPLLDRISVEPDSEVTKSPLFSSPAESECLKLLTEIYVARSHSMWANRQVILWLENNVRHVLRNQSSSDVSRKDKNFPREIPKTVLRHALLSKYPKTLSLIPIELKEEKTAAIDPVPPSDSIASYEIKISTPSASENDSNILGVFLKSWLPSFRPDETTRESQAQAPGSERPGERNESDLRQSITNVMGAMKDLLSNITIDQNDGESEEEN